MCLGIVSLLSTSTFLKLQGAVSSVARLKLQFGSEPPFHFNAGYSVIIASSQTLNFGYRWIEFEERVEDESIVGYGIVKVKCILGTSDEKRCVHSCSSEGRQKIVIRSALQNLCAWSICTRSPSVRTKCNWGTCTKYEAYGPPLFVK